jgi:hypothetical protein
VTPAGKCNYWGSDDPGNGGVTCPGLVSSLPVVGQHAAFAGRPVMRVMIYSLSGRTVHVSTARAVDGIVRELRQKGLPHGAYLMAGYDAAGVRITHRKITVR